MRFVRIFAISATILLLCLVAKTPGYASTTAHGCAQPVPPLMSGSPGPPPATPGIVLINEILNNPGSNWNCSEPAGTSSPTTDSWVELYNPQNQPFNLYEARASVDSGSIDNAFHFPFGAVIAAHGYLVVFPEANSVTSTSIAGITIRFMFGGVTIIDQVSIPALAPDYSYARIPDGSANWQITPNPTIDASNTPLPQTTPTHTPVSTKRSGHSGNGNGSSSGGTAYTTPTLVTGKQTGWSKLQFPATNSTTTSLAHSPLVTTPTPLSTNNAADVPRRILLTILVVALALSLFWCWKSFAPR